MQKWGCVTTTDKNRLFSLKTLGCYKVVLFLLSPPPILVVVLSF